MMETVYVIVKRANDEGEAYSDKPASLASAEMKMSNYSAGLLLLLWSYV